MSAPTTPKKRKSTDEQPLINLPMEETPHKTREAMSRELGKGKKGDYTGKELFKDEDDDNKPTAAMRESARYIQQVKNLPTQSGVTQTALAPGAFDTTKEEKEEEQKGGVLEFFGLAGGRKRKSKRTKRMARKSRRKSRSRRRRGGEFFRCSPSSSSKYYCPCPSTMGMTNKKCKDARTGAAAYYWNNWIARGDEGKKWKALQHLKRKNSQFKNMSDTDLKALKLKTFIAKFEKTDADKQASEQYWEKKKSDEEAFATLAGQKGIAGDAAFLAQKMGATTMPGAGKRRRRRKSRKKRRKSRKKRRKSRKKRRKSRKKRRSRRRRRRR